MAVAGAAAALVLLIARKQISDLVWKLPLGRRGIVVAAVLRATGALVAVMARSRRPSN